MQINEAKDGIRNNYTTMSEGIKSYEQFQEWLTYDNTEFLADRNFKESWGDVDKLKSLFPGQEIYLVTINANDTENSQRPSPVRKESEEKQRYTFAFDIAVVGISNDEYWWIWYRIMKYRNEKMEDNRTETPWNTRAIVALARATILIQKHPHIDSHFS